MTRLDLKKMMTRFIVIEIILTSHIACSIRIARNPTPVALNAVDDQLLESTNDGTNTKLGASLSVALFSYDPMEAVYNRMSKTGGSTLESILKQVVPDNSMIVGEASGLQRQLKQNNKTRERVFVIGSIRNPCGIYLSMWSMMNDQAVEISKKVHGEKFDRCFGKNQELLSPGMQTKTQKPPSSEQINAFQKWMRSKETEGMVSYRFAWKYLDGPNHHACDLCGPSSCMELSEHSKRMEGDWSQESLADCWVNTDDLGQDLKRCLKLYEAKSGVHVKWENFDKLVDPERANKSGHGECKAYFDKETAKLVEEGVDKPMFGKFGFKECCA